MRLHPLSLALRSLRGQRTIHGRDLPGVEQAQETLRHFTGEDFGADAKRWGEWLRRNRWAYQGGPRPPSE